MTCISIYIYICTDVNHILMSLLFRPRSFKVPFPAIPMAAFPLSWSSESLGDVSCLFAQ